MPADKQAKKSTWNRLIGEFDNVLIPVALGLLTMTLLVQVAATNPAVQSRLDRLEGRFSAVPTQVIPPTVNSETAAVTLYLSPSTGQHPNVTVSVNGKPVANFTSASAHLNVKEGDRITLTSNDLTGPVYITVDHNDPNLLFPAPGQVVELSPNDPTGQLPSVEFTH